MNSLYAKQFKRFKENKRAWYSLILITVLFVLSLVAELYCNNKPVVLRFQGQYYFPLFKNYPSHTFGESETIKINYRDLFFSTKFQTDSNWMLFPLIPHHPNESSKHLASPPPTGPDSEHWLGTDDRGRDLTARLIYGFRNSMIFALLSWFFIVLIGYLIGALQGYRGGKTDLIGQRLTEIWSALPVLYVIIFLVSMFKASIFLLMIVWVAFGWMGVSSYIRAEVLKVRKLEYVTAAQGLGSSELRILLRHLMPNTMTPVITLSPFLISSAIGSLAALDYLGLGLPPPTSSWGELLRQGKDNLSSWWLSCFPFLCLFFSLLLINFIGEGTRAAFDARSHDR